MKVFISHSSKDKSASRVISNELTGGTTFLDEKVDTMDSFLGQNAVITSIDADGDYQLTLTKENIFWSDK